MSKLFDLRGKVAVITGAGKGIGKEIAFGLADAGADLVLVSRTSSQLEAVAREITGVDTLVVPADVTQKAEIENVCSKTLSRWGKIDILINNAGMTLKKPAVDLAMEEWQKVIDVNLTGIFICAQAMGQQMVKQQSGSIINMASVGGHLALTESSAYCASKGGILQITKVLASEWAPYNVRVNALSPGYVETELVEGVMAARPDLKEKIIKRTPMGRIAKPKEIVGSAVFLASDASSYITGISLLVDGGMSALGV